MCEYSLIWVGHGKARYWVFIFIHMVQEFWKVWLLHLGKLINLGWVVWHVLVETLIQMMHLRMTRTMFLMVWSVLWSEGLGGQQLSAVVVTLYKFKLANGLAVFRLSLTTPKA